MGERDATLNVAVAMVLSIAAMLVVAVVVVTDATVVVAVVVVSTALSAEADKLADAVVAVVAVFGVELSSGGGDASSHRAWLRTNSLTLGFPPY